ncbi:hypothetical protein SBV1_1200008 [Verrucomicrobia bacterium]|nr:hypothetical protein SBV1_1200008 [Verrucomicrobiota bacterium]
MGFQDFFHLHYFPNIGEPDLAPFTQDTSTEESAGALQRGRTPAFWSAVAAPKAPAREGFRSSGLGGAERRGILECS